MIQNLPASLFAWLFCLSAMCHAYAENYASFNSIEEVIQFETNTISQTSPADIVRLAELHLDRGESFLIHNEFEKALEDFYTAYILASSLFGNERPILIFRSLMGAMIATDDGDLQKMEEMAAELMATLDSFECAETSTNEIPTQLFCSSIGIFSKSKKEKEKKKEAPSERESEKTNTNTTEILGPDYNVPGWCEEITVGTARAMTEIIEASVKGSKKHAVLIGIVTALEARALRCCATGDFWKACVLPIVEKWKLWKDKWFHFGIPPDPAWD